jgi:hypothetical protein
VHAWEECTLARAATIKVHGDAIEPRCYDRRMGDPLREDDRERARRTSLAERARQALDMMRMGYGLKRSALRARHPHATEGEIDALFRGWLEGNDR